MRESNPPKRLYRPRTKPLIQQCITYIVNVHQYFYWSVCWESNPVYVHPTHVGHHYHPNCDAPLTSPSLRCLGNFYPWPILTSLLIPVLIDVISTGFAQGILVSRCLLRITTHGSESGTCTQLSTLQGWCFAIKAYKEYFCNVQDIALREE